LLLLPYELVEQIWGSAAWGQSPDL